MKPKALAWKSFSAYIRAKTPYCVFHAKVGAVAPCRCAGVLQTCHKVSRSKSSILFDERNVFTGCAGSNTWANFNKEEWGRLWHELWPEDIDRLDMCKDIIVHRKAKDYLAIADHYKRKLKELDGVRVKNVIRADG